MNLKQYLLILLALYLPFTINSQNQKLLFCKWSGVGTPIGNGNSCQYMIHTTSDTIWYWDGINWLVKLPVTGMSTLEDAYIDSFSNLRLSLSNATELNVPIVYGLFNDDYQAEIGGVPLGGMYRVSTENPYGMSYGTIRIRLF